MNTSKDWIMLSGILVNEMSDDTQYTEYVSRERTVGMVELLR